MEGTISALFFERKGDIWGLKLHQVSEAHRFSHRGIPENLKDKMNARIEDKNAKHSYEVEVKGGYVKVDANTRTQAAKRAEKAGYTVRSVNLVG